MFEVGFGELLMLGIVVLLVVGPEQLPKVARTAGLWLGRARRIVSSMQADVERELRAEEMKKFLSQQHIENPLHIVDEILDHNGETIKGENLADVQKKPSADAASRTEKLTTPQHKHSE